ncbi:HWE histidine kinase domain-containing protein [Bradyrhizobium sp. JYMT SZCCT0180]|uniref:sensor histidine kinase n=1 Tax=Bradyrhizobium sp. JYMT SZCCT0180 TaxID=2807666 RepID=UPI001BAB3D44|nr:HWE histidine kinase domain-containing protein [Bradyrhizobium sp. JYMT SZCCT0180]MBR1216225.1 PAS domain-containing protein [Bradyrhizobium sp. JYMT SZCCT0180]
MKALSEPGAESDVTSEEALRRAEDFYDVANNLPTLCWIADPNGSIFWYNRRWYEYTGASPESQHGWGWTSVHDAHRLPDVLKRWKHSIATGEPFEMTFPLKGNDGIFRPFLTRVVPLRDPAGLVVRWLGTNVDISAQVAAETSLRESEALYRSALTAGRMGTWQTDLVSKTRLWTQEGMALFGLNLADGRGHVGGDDDEYWSALHPDDRHLMHKFHELADKQDSFTSEYRVVWPDGSILWLRGHGQVVARTPDGKAHRMVSIVADVTKRKATEDHIQFLMHELSHRSKNLLTVIQSIARRTARTVATMEEFESRFGRRLQGLAASHDVLVLNSWQGAPLAHLMRKHLEPFVDVQSSRLELSGPDIVVSAEAAQAIGLAIHELTTNAIKYGALSVPTGKVKVSWAFDGDEDAPRQLLLNWIEQGGPPVVPPSHKGFGHVVFEDMIERSLNGKVAVEFAASGLSWRVSIPAANLKSDDQKTAPAPGRN